jgi:hypothetical protein
VDAGPASADFATDCASPTHTYPDVNGLPTNLNLNATDVILFASGTFTGSVNSNGATICVANGAAFNPANINGTARLFVRGTAVMPPLAAGNGAVLDNEGVVTFEGQPNTNGIADVINRAGATIVVNAPGLPLGAGVTVTNDGTITVSGGVNLNGSTVINNGQLSIGGSVNVVGMFTNNGHTDISGLLTMNSNSTLTNACSLQADGLIEDANATNNGVITLGASALTIEGSATYAQGPTRSPLGATSPTTAARPAPASTCSRERRRCTAR